MPALQSLDKASFKIRYKRVDLISGDGIYEQLIHIPI